jgi:hypothetical protein
MDFEALATPVEISDEQLGEAISDKELRGCSKHPPTHQSADQGLYGLARGQLPQNPERASLGIYPPSRKDWFTAHMMTQELSYSPVILAPRILGGCGVSSRRGADKLGSNEVFGLSVRSPSLTTACRIPGTSGSL